MIGEKIKLAIESRGLSMAEVAHLLGTSTSNLYVLFKKEHMDTKHLESFSKILNLPMSYFFDNYNEPIKPSQKSLDGGKFGTEVEEELRSQIDQLKRDKEFLQRMMERMQDSYDKLAEAVGKEHGAEARCLPLVPDEAPAEIKMRA